MKFDANLESVKRNLKFVKQDGKIATCIYVCGLPVELYPLDPLSKRTRCQLFARENTC